MSLPVPRDSMYNMKRIVPEPQPPPPTKRKLDQIQPEVQPSQVGPITDQYFSWNNWESGCDDYEDNVFYDVTLDQSIYDSNMRLVIKQGDRFKRVEWCPSTSEVRFCNGDTIIRCGMRVMLIASK